MQHRTILFSYIFYVYTYNYIIRLNHYVLYLYWHIKSSNVLYLDTVQNPFIVISACKHILPYLYVPTSS